ncbi:protein FMC1 homolog isoform X3 [Portunus trituberculatus]|uniref:protein FMC1 homolog isoform X3 n=1 Tax=Portunus trituberculatus TaxID=210409 RepID=UPI001E1CCCDE|nr:protein FMC1 homolog isoform X3 [Portunus trituberculatus]
MLLFFCFVFFALYSGAADPKAWLWSNLLPPVASRSRSRHATGRTADMAATTPKIQTLRCLIREIRRTLLPHENLRHSPAFEYMMKEYRHNAVTDQQCCRQQEEMAYLAHTCATYLEASRRYQELHQEYHCRGERTVKETADIVGFKLPNEH